MTRIGCLQKSVAAEKRGAATDRDPSASAALLAGAAIRSTVPSLSPTIKISSFLCKHFYPIKIEPIILMKLRYPTRFNF